jgi:hypothetical protein
MIKRRGWATVFCRPVLGVATILNLAFLALFPSRPPLVRAASSAGDSSPQVELNGSNATPRSLEGLTQQNISRHYGKAWQDLADGFANNSPASLNNYFVGAARDQLDTAISDQQIIGVHSRYLTQRHKIDVAFYAPEGDLVELHDTLQCELQVLDGETSIHNEQAILHYVVLMTPSADRWVIRQLQAVSEF